MTYIIMVPMRLNVLWLSTSLIFNVAGVTEIGSIHDVDRNTVFEEMKYNIDEQTSLPPKMPPPLATGGVRPSLPRVPSFTRPVPDEQRLLQYLFHSYERTVRPVSNASTPVVIRMGLTLTQIFDMDEKDQILVTNVWLDQEWEDEFMIWDPEQFANITTLRIPCFKLWLPDIVLYNNAAEYTDGVMPANAMVRYDGNVFWPVPTKLQSSCKVDVTYFPFDEQTCYMKFGSWTYDGFQVDITNRTEEVDLSNYVNNGEWELLDVKIIRNVVYYTCCKEPFPDVTFTIHIRRRTLYYMYNVIFPCIMMSALTLLVFCLPPDSGEKIALGITVLLAFSVFMLAVAENLPETSEFVPLISIYLTIVMALTSMSVIMTVFVLNLHHRGPNKRAVPTWLKKLLHGVSPYLFLRENIPDSHRYYNNEERMIKNVSLKITLDSIQQALQNETQLEVNNCNAMGNSGNSVSRVSSVNADSEGTGTRPDGYNYNATPHINIDTSSNNIMNTNQQVDNQVLTGLNAHVQHQHYCHYNPQTSQYTSQTGAHLNPNIIDTNSNQSASINTSPCRNGNNKRTKRRSNSQVSKTNEEILKSLKRILEKHEKEDRDYEVVQDWRRVAQCVDRILFFIFLLATFFSTVGILVIAPVTQ